MASKKTPAKLAAPAGTKKTAVQARGKSEPAREPKAALPGRSTAGKAAAKPAKPERAPREQVAKSKKTPQKPLKNESPKPTTKEAMGNSVTAQRSKGKETKATSAKAAPKEKAAKGAPPKVTAAKAPAKGKLAPKESAKVAPKPEPTPIEEVETVVAAEQAPRVSIKPKNPERPTLEELRQMPTEDIWAYYRKGAQARPKDEKYVEDMRNVLMEAHLPLVKHIAERLLQTLPKSIELGDLESAGAFGLMDAIRGFDPDRGIKFKTYCTTRIRGSILDQLRSQDWVPRLVRLKASRIEKTLRQLQGEYGREPTHAELATALQMDHSELAIELTQSRAKSMVSINERYSDHDDDGGTEKIEIVEDEKASDPVNELNRRDLMLYITKSLNHKERFIIEQYYDVGHTMREIGEMLALTESRVCQIHSNVMARLKGLLSPDSGDLEA
ncbi:MAG: FliA/WhiG family RNA polymerase sigma factor [Planctomycetaceae bacterium]|nr:FliA/WhiG family RNA polymerase sigma factor [Planctomycetaceae bacterium]